MGSCAAPSAKGDDKFITTDYLQQCRIASERMEIISGQRLIDLLTPGSSFTIATAPQTMMKRTAATLETSTIVKDAGRGRLRKRKIKHAKPVAAVAMA
ncbi:hypothetical protein ABEM49_27465 [Escherichia coli]